MNRRRVGVLAVVAGIALGAGEAFAAKASNKTAASQVRTDIRAELSIEPATADSKGLIRENTEVRVQFRLRDGAGGTPLKGLRPAAWLDLRADSTQGTEKPEQCREKIRAFLQRGLGYRPVLDLNQYYLLVLNEEASISVIDPLLGFGSSKLLTTVLLPGPGVDWALSADGNRLYVALATERQVAVVDTAAWRVSHRVAIQGKPTRLALQPDGRYLWAGMQASGGEKPNAGGVSVIDTEKLAVVADFATGAGPHELAFGDDNRHAFVSDGAMRAVDVIDIARLAQVRHLELTAAPVSVAYSTLAKAVYVGHADGAIQAIDAERVKLTARLTAGPGLTQLRFSPDGRWGFALSGTDPRVTVFDAATNQPVGTFEVGAQPDQLAFTDNYAYIRSSGTAQISMIELRALNRGGAVAVARFSAGQAAPATPSRAVAASAITPAPEPNAMLVANSGDKTLYYYGEGMAAPMGSFQNYGNTPRAVQVLDRSLRETAPGVYAATVRFPRSGAYDIALLVNDPRFEQCFVAQVEPEPVGRKPRPGGLQLEFLLKDKTIQSSTPLRLQFRLTDPSGEPGDDRLHDVQVQMLLTPGAWSQIASARPLGGGLYETELTAPRPGVYYVFVQAPSRGVRYEHLPNLILRAGPSDALPD